jgi:hypothetical protein
MAETSKTSKTANPGFTAGQEIVTIASEIVIERDNSITAQGVEAIPRTKLDRSEEVNQNLGTSVSCNCTVEPNEESWEGNTELTITTGGSVYTSVVDNVILPDVPTSTKETDEVRTLGTLGESNKTRLPLDEELEETVIPSTATDIEIYPNAEGWMKAATCLPPNKGTELGLRDKI